MLAHRNAKAQSSLCPCAPESGGLRAQRPRGGGRHEVGFCGLHAQSGEGGVVPPLLVGLAAPEASVHVMICIKACE